MLGAIAKITHSCGVEFMLRFSLLCVLSVGLMLGLWPAPALANSACHGLSIDVPATADCDAEIAANPAPNVVPLAPDYRALSHYTFMRIAHGEEEKVPVQVVDAPGGDPVRSIDSGFNFVTVIQAQDGWYQINAGEWIHERDLEAERASPFAGVQVVDPLTYPLAWILINTYTAEYPGGPQIIDPERLHYRYDRVNVYATVEVDGHNWYLIAPGEWVYHTWVGIAQRVPRPEGVSGRWIAVDLYEQTLTAYEDDRLVFATLVSSGLPNWETGEGLFSVWARFESDHMSGASGRPDYYSLENVPYTIYFDGDISLHGTYWHDGFGYRHSHGCVNLSITDSRWLFDWTNAEAFREAPVYVFASGQYG